MSAIVPVYNGARYLAEAIDSVLAQTWPSVEIIVIDDGSTDGSAAIAHGYGAVRCISQMNRGLGAARNRGATEARGDFLAFLDADDRWIADKLDRQLAALRDTPADMVFGHLRPFFSPEIHRPPGEHRAPAVIAGYSACSMLINRARFHALGEFATEWRVGEFIDWFARASHAGATSLMLPQVVVERRLHRDNMGVERRGDRADYLRIVKAALDRQRGREPRAALSGDIAERGSCQP